MSAPARRIRGGLTLLELLAALSLLSFVVVAASAWCTGLARLEREVRSTNRGDALERTLDALDADVRLAPRRASRAESVLFDLEVQEVRTPRRALVDGLVRTAWVAWRFDPRESAVVRADQGGGGTEARVALREVDGWEVEPVHRVVRQPGRPTENRTIGYRVRIVANGIERSRFWEASP